MHRILVGLVAALILSPGLAGENKTTAQKPADALRALNDLIGSWRASGTPEGTREEKQRGFWTETISWTWQFKGDDVALKVYLYSRAQSVMGGTSQVQRNLIATRILGLP